MLQRFGQFLFLIGVLLLALFFLSDRARAAQYELLLAAGLLFLFYWLIARRGRKRRESSRFRTLRKLTGARRNDLPEDER